MELTSSSRFILTGAVLMSMLVSTTISIRVDWNTNKGAIMPPTPTPPPPPPQRPYAEPAPVWEDQSNDIPNPNPYEYVPPPPSRPRYNQHNDIRTNEIAEGNEIDDGRYNQNYPTKQNNDGSFFVDVPPNFYKTTSPAKQQYYQQKYFNDILNKNGYSPSNSNYNIIAFKNTYRNMPYYVFYFARVPHQQQQQQQQQPQQQQQQQQQQQYLPHQQQQYYQHQPPAQLPPTGVAPVQSN